jgi:hypothetical protein
MFHTVCCFKLDYKLIFPAHITYTLREFCCIFYLTINPTADPVVTNFKEHKKPIATEVVKTFLAFCGTRTFITISKKSLLLGKIFIFLAVWFILYSHIRYRVNETLDELFNSLNFGRCV